VFRRACNEATLLVAISDYARDSVIRQGALAPDRVRTIHHRLGNRFAGAPGRMSRCSRDWGSRADAT